MKLSLAAAAKLIFCARSPKTKFLIEAEKNGHKTLNGRDMFLYQAQKAFNLWHNLTPRIDKKLINYLYND